MVSYVAQAKPSAGFILDQISAHIHAACWLISPCFPCLSPAHPPGIGRFGIGFNSVYHLTELPSFVSAGSWCSFDPQAKFLPNVNPSNPGKMVNFVQHPETVRRYPDQVVDGFGSVVGGLLSRVRASSRVWECDGVKWSRAWVPLVRTQDMASRECVFLTGMT